MAYDDWKSDQLRKEAGRSEPRLFKVEKPNGELCMIAPIWAISDVLRLHKDAENRIFTETVNGEKCYIYANRNNWGRFGEDLVITNFIA